MKFHTEGENMAIYAVQGLYAAGCLALAYPLYRDVLNPSFLANHKDVLTRGDDIKGLVDSQAQKMELKKEIVVIQGEKNGYRSYGNTWFGMVGIYVAQSEQNREFHITHQLAHIKANDNLTVFGGALAAVLFTTLVLAVNRDLFTGYLGGMGAGLITGVVLRRRAEKRADLTAMQNCSDHVNRSFLNRLQKDKENGNDQDLSSWIFCLVEPSLDEKIGYFQAHIQQAL